jgi:hypothetical protein
VHLHALNRRDAITRHYRHEVRRYSNPRVARYVVPVNAWLPFNLDRNWLAQNEVHIVRSKASKRRKLKRNGPLAKLDHRAASFARLAFNVKDLQQLKSLDMLP